jgi:hypothetical protein
LWIKICRQNRTTKSEDKKGGKRLNMYLIEERAMQQQRTQHIAAHNTSTTLSIITITITASLIINHGDPKHYTPVI